MSFRGFQTFDPYLSFAEGERGYREKVFLRADGTPTETAWYGHEHDGNGYLSAIWRIGRDAYAILASRTGYEPKLKDFKEIAVAIKELEKDIAPMVQPMIDDGRLVLHEHRDAPPVASLAATLEDAPDGWMLEVFMRMVRPSVVSGDLKDEDLPDFEGFLSAAAILYLDDYIIAAQLGHEVETAFELIMVNISSAKLYRETVEAARAAVSSVGRRSAGERHKATNSQKVKALGEWDETGHTYSGMAAFARHRHKSFEVTERTLYSWVRDHRKAKS